MINSKQQMIFCLWFQCKLSISIEVFMTEFGVISEFCWQLKSLLVNQGRKCNTRFFISNSILCRSGTMNTITQVVKKCSTVSTTYIFLWNVQVIIAVCDVLSLNFGTFAFSCLDKCSCYIIIGSFDLVPSSNTLSRVLHYD